MALRPPSMDRAQANMKRRVDILDLCTNWMTLVFDYPMLNTIQALLFSGIVFYTSWMRCVFYVKRARVLFDIKEKRW